VKSNVLTTTFEFNPELHHALSTFDDLSDLESEEDFLNGIVDLREQSTNDLKRSRSATCSTTLSSFLGEVDYEDCSSVASTGYSSIDSSEERPAKKIKCSQEASEPTMNMAAGSSEGGSGSQHTPANEQTAQSNHTSVSGSDGTTAALPAPTNRRGRKQSLTEDPSKTFVCELCNRRFRRQEHLKRHCK
jgi:hypothetical protein